MTSLQFYRSVGRGEVEKQKVAVGSLLPGPSISPQTTYWETPAIPPGYRRPWAVWVSEDGEKENRLQEKVTVILVGTTDNSQDVEAT